MRGMPLQQTSSNLDDFLYDVPFGLLPRTFQHAVIAAHQLGARFLWIDALCIIQNVEQDW